MRFKWMRIALLEISCVFFLGLSAGAGSELPLRLATFRCDVTPPLGEPLIWNVPLTNIDDTLLAKGILLEYGQERYVICALDWCELANDSALCFRAKLAAGARTEVSRVALQCIHQHTAPYADARAHELLDVAPQPLAHLSDPFLRQVGQRLAEAAGKAMEQLVVFDQIGTGEAKVVRVASTRRIHADDGRIIVRNSNEGGNPALAEAPEGAIDPLLKTVTLAHGHRPLVRLHYYATHPQTSSGTGRASSDFVGLAREALELKEHVFQIYFTGCAGDVTVGKYNDGSPQARLGLSQRLRAGMEAAIAATRFSPVKTLVWRTVPLRLPLRTDPGFTLADYRSCLADSQKMPAERIYNGALRIAFVERCQIPLQLSCLQLGRVCLLHLPGEPMLAFQKYAQQLKPTDFIGVAGYGDCGPGYICTDEAFVEGGYEPTDSGVAPGSEALLKRAIRRLLAE